ncbi:putative deferrochelatase/peroxidase EfeN precursor [Nonomuraea coxensis DSM 45129]|uniref:Deferrochelatase/peroxidase EfeN n=1 Tax=Nonomuraea coxensis DSM 45129 TaxID=1122611 RepID=A0ABX8TZT7_9ACTN|nr:Dyp-type peroxidase [Nonomuraea coxensis]QYC40950.1 putative deferrochelatase/peroxidase EfeN precursor [Nonomuraea coxensis DSM 45129]
MGERPAAGGGGHRLTRRGLLSGGALAAAATVTGGAVVTSGAEASRGATAANGGAPEVVPFHGPHQAGVATPPQAHAVFVAFDLRKGVGREALARMMRLLTDDARRLTQGRPALADTEPELAELPARLSVTFGFGPGLFDAAGVAEHRPESVAALPAFTIDRLRREWSGGDLLAQICADDPLTVTHALRMIVKDARAFARVRWTQRGFRRAAHSQPGGTTQRNVMGQLDGTVNPVPGTPDFDRAVWIEEGRMSGGTTLVLRRIRAEMETWDAADTTAKEFTVGRRLADGAPLTGGREHDEPDFGKLTPVGFPVISEYAHIRRARVPDPGLRMLRRVYNYDEGVGADGTADCGLLFAAYQADIARQFIPVQRRLAEADLLNEWTTPIGSAVFAVPPGCGPDGWIGQTLLG